MQDLPLLTITTITMSNKNPITMATIKFLLRGKSNPSVLYLRFLHTKQIDIFYRTQILIDPAHWDAKKEQIKNISAVKNRNELNIKLNELQVHILTEFNNSYIQGEIIDKAWIASKVNEFFNRPTSENNFQIKKEEVYLTSFATWWIENKATKHKVAADKYMNDKSISHYSRLRDLLIEFEGNNKIKLTDIDNKVLDNFSSYLSNDRGFSETTVHRHVSRAKFFCERAEKMNLKVNKGYREIVYIKKTETPYKAPYLNTDEINKIYNLKINDKKKEAIRDNFIIGLWTGMRVSDFLTRLSMDDIQGDFINIKTFKTNHSVTIPLHPQIKEILKKWNGLPPKTFEQEFNREIKSICKLANITNMITGGKIKTKVDNSTGEDTVRKEVGEYPKYKLVSSHICRRSFATNHIGKLPNKVIMDVCGWKSEKQMLEYNKQTNLESAKILAEFWKQQNI